MGHVLIRNLDDEVIARLKLKAELKGRSLTALLREILTTAAPLSPDEKVALSRQLRATSLPLHGVDPGAAVRYGRDDEAPPSCR